MDSNPNKLQNSRREAFYSSGLPIANIKSMLNCGLCPKISGYIINHLISQTTFTVYKLETHTIKETKVHL